MKKIVLIILGFISLCLGIIGIFLPMLPTTPFFLLSAWCFIRSSQKLYDWLINHKIFGIYIKNYILHKSITKKSKIIAISSLWLTIGYCIVFVVEPILLKVMLFLIASSVTGHLLSLKTLVIHEN